MAPHRCRGGAGAQAHSRAAFGRRVPHRRWLSALVVWWCAALLLVGAATLCSGSNFVANGWRACRRTAQLRLTPSTPRRGTLTATKARPGGKSLQEIKDGPDVVDGVVVRKTKFGVFVDIGAKRDALIANNRTLAFKLNAAEKLTGLKHTVDLEKQVLSVTVPDLEELVKDRPSNPKPEKQDSDKGGDAKDTAVAASGGGGKAPSVTVSVDPTDSSRIEVQLNGLRINSADLKTGRLEVSFDDQVFADVQSSNENGKNAKPKATKAKKEPEKKVEKVYEGLQVGQEIDGKVKVKNRYGVWIDIGRKKDVRLNTTEEVGKKLRFGEELQGLVIDKYDEQAQQIQVVLKDAESVVAGREITALKLEDVKEGTVMKAYVKDKNRYGTFLDCGCEVDARLNMPSKKSMIYELGQELDVKVEQVDLEKRQVGLVLAEAAE